MFDNLQFLNDLYNFTKKHNINFSILTYTEQMAVIRSMLVSISRSNQLKRDRYICTFCGHIWKKPYDFCSICNHSNSIFKYFSLPSA